MSVKAVPVKEDDLLKKDGPVEKKSSVEESPVEDSASEEVEEEEEEAETVVQDKILKADRTISARNKPLYFADYLLKIDNESVVASNTTVSGASLGWVAIPVLLVVILLVVVVSVVWGRWLYVTGEGRYSTRVQREHALAEGRGTEETQSTISEVLESSEEVDELSDRRELVAKDK